MIEKFHRDRDIGRIGGGKLGTNLEHVLTEEGHPRGAIGLFEMAASWQRRRTVENPDVIQAKKPTFEGIVSGTIFPVHPPIEV